MLKLSDGAWSSGPTSYVYEWQRCNATGRHCAAIANAFGQKYTLRRGDVGHRIRALEWAYNITGTGVPQTSALTSLVVSAWAISRPRLAGIANDSPSLTLSIVSDVRSASLKTIDIRLPGGLFFLAGATPSSLTVLAGRQRVKFASEISGRLIRIALRRPVSSVRIIVTGPLLQVSNAMVVSARRHRLGAVVLRVVLTQLHGLTTGQTRTVRAA